MAESRRHPQRITSHVTRSVDHVDQQSRERGCGVLEWQWRWCQYWQGARHLRTVRRGQDILALQDHGRVSTVASCTRGRRDALSWDNDTLLQRARAAHQSVRVASARVREGRRGAIRLQGARSLLQEVRFSLCVCMRVCVCVCVCVPALAVELFAPCESLLDLNWFVLHSALVGGGVCCAGL